MMRVLMTRLLASVLALLLIWQPAVAGITYYHNDALGSPVAATDENGKLLWREAYAPFGEKLNNSPAQGDSRIAYTGKLHDDDTGLTYMNARYYDPVVGRFMAIDPVGPLQGGLEHVNRYVYVNNNPFRYVDPTGLYADCICPGGDGNKAEKAADARHANDPGIKSLIDFGLEQTLLGTIHDFMDAAKSGSFTQATMAALASLPGIKQARLAGRAVMPGMVGTYGELKSLKRAFGETEPLDMDHQPSFAAQVAALEASLNRTLTSSERNTLRQNSPAVASPRAVHQQTSPTYGGRNTPERIAADAADLTAAQIRDRAAFDKAMQSRWLH